LIFLMTGLAATKQQKAMIFLIPILIKILKIYDLNGKTIKEFKLSNASNKMQLNELDLSAGVYLYQLICDGEKGESKQFVVQ